VDLTLRALLAGKTKFWKCSRHIGGCLVGRLEIHRTDRELDGHEGSGIGILLEPIVESHTLLQPAVESIGFSFLRSLISYLTPV
jgi:hypothetical protein